MEPILKFATLGFDSGKPGSAKGSPERLLNVIAPFQAVKETSGQIGFATIWKGGGTFKRLCGFDYAIGSGQTSRRPHFAQNSPIQS